MWQIQRVQEPEEQGGGHLNHRIIRHKSRFVIVFVRQFVKIQISEQTCLCFLPLDHELTITRMKKKAIHEDPHY